MSAFKKKTAHRSNIALTDIKMHLLRWNGHRAKLTHFILTEDKFRSKKMCCVEKMTWFKKRYTECMASSFNKRITSREKSIWTSSYYGKQSAKVFLQVFENANKYVYLCVIDGWFRWQMMITHKNRSTFIILRISQSVRN
jgi:hypothetical protein